MTGVAPDVDLGIALTMKHAREEFYPAFETQDKYYHKSKVGVPVNPQKG